MEHVFRLNLRHLRLLEAIARHGSISAAARDVGLSQPALTQALAGLEALFGAALFDRTRTGVLPTPVGVRVLARVARAAAILRDALAPAGDVAQRRDPQNFLTTAHVRGLLALADAGSFTGAAAQASVSVPALHRAVRDLEQLLAVSLVERRGRGVGLTRAGRRLARRLTGAVAELAAALEEGVTTGGRLAIGAMALSRSLLLPATLADLLRREPAARVDVVEGSYLELVEQLRGGRIDILVGALRETAPNDVEQRPLFSDRLTIIGRATHPLAGREASFEELAAYPWIVARRASALLERWRRMFDAAGKPRPSAPIQCGSVALIRGLLVRSDFLTLLSPAQVLAEIDAGSLARIRSVVPDTDRTIGVITRRDWYPTRLQQVFLHLLQENCHLMWSAGAPPA